MDISQDHDAYRLPFDPSCTVWTTFGELQLGDEVDYWGAACPIVELATFEGDPVRVRIEVQQKYGRQLALAPAYEGTWRAPREGEAVEVAELFPAERFDGGPADSEGWDPDDPYGDVAEYERKAGE